MLKFSFLWGLCIFCWASSFLRAQSGETAVRESINAYVTAFNAGDLAALLNCWSETAVWDHADGTRSVGQAEISSQLASGLAGQGTLEIVSSELRFLTPDVAIEEGVARLSIAGEIVGEERYEATHVSTPQGWKMARLREIPATVLSVNPNLQPLSWLVGDWIDQSETATVTSSVTWSSNQAFLVNKFSVEFSDAEPLSGVQIIGWDPTAQTIRSWVFDSDGGFGQATWEQKGDQWLAHSEMTLADGRQAEASNFYAPQSPDSYLWRSIGRKVGSEYLPNTENVLVVRQTLTATTVSPTSSTPVETSSSVAPTSDTASPPADKE